MCVALSMNIYHFEVHFCIHIIKFQVCSHNRPLIYTEKMAGWMGGHQKSFQELINPRPRPVDNSSCVGESIAAQVAHYLLRLNDRISERSEKRLVSTEPTLPPEVPVPNASMHMPGSNYCPCHPPTLHRPVTRPGRGNN